MGLGEEMIGKGKLGAFWGFRMACDVTLYDQWKKKKKKKDSSNSLFIKDCSYSFFFWSIVHILLCC